jgi:transposase-like protein
MNVIQLSEKIKTELDASKLFEKYKYGKEIKCAYCGSKNLSPRSKDLRFFCYDCKKNSGVKVNTNLHDTKISLIKWLYAFSIISDAKKGLSAMQLARHIDISIPSAHSMYHKIRQLMSIENKNIELEGIVEMDETYIGGKPRKARRNSGPVGNINELDWQLSSLSNKFEFKEGEYKKPYSKLPPKRGRGTKKIPVVGIVERDGNVIAQVMRHTTYDNLKNMVKKFVKEDDSVLVTDDYKGYTKMNRIIEHITIDHKKMFSYKGINTNSIESFWAIVKRQIIGQHHSVSAKYLPNYIAELVFKYNNRKNNDMFVTLVKNAMLPM